MVLASDPGGMYETAILSESGAGAEAADGAGDAAFAVDEGAAAVGTGAGAGDDEGADANLATGHG
jgi:hypothetical protein